MPAAMTTWTWRLDDAQGHPMQEPTAEVFTSRGDAESWIGEKWPALAAQGVRRAQMLSGDVPFGRPLLLKQPVEG